MLKKNLRTSMFIGVFAIIAIASLLFMFGHFNLNKKANSNDGYEIVFVASSPEMTSFEKEAYDGMVEIAEKIDKTYTVVYSQTNSGNNEQTTMSAANDSSSSSNGYKVADTPMYVEAVKSAVSKDTRLVILPGSNFEECAHLVQENYLDTYFLLLDGVPKNTADTDQTVNYNTISVTFAEADAGFLAGYALACGNYKNAGYIGNSSEACSTKYGYGLLQGMNYAAKEKKIKNLKMNYCSAGSKKSVKNFTKKMKNLNCDIVVVCTGSLDADTIEELKSSKLPVICLNNDFRNDFSCVIGYAGKDLKKSVYTTVEAFFDENLSIDKKTNYGAWSGNVFFHYDANKFEGFTEKDYNNIYSKIADDSIKIISDTTVLPDDLGLDSIKYTYYSSSDDSKKKTDNKKTNK